MRHWWRRLPIRSHVDSFSGDFDTFSAPSLTEESWDFSQLSSNGVVRFLGDQNVLLGDCNQDGVVDFLDIAPFIGFLSTGIYFEEADCNQDGVVSFLDIAPFIAILSGS